MPRPDFALLCRAATDDGALVNMLGAGITSVTLPQFPAVVPVTLVARFYWEHEAEGVTQLLSIRVEHPDGERIVSLENPITPVATAPGSPDEARAQNILINLTLDLRRPGEYRVMIVVNGDPVLETPLAITAQMPTL